ncbi:MAG: hypothetical protein KJ737_16000 [Proteobacteria bacterium]|nr:hypothetical protein [Pseudomonadota bacterium]
MKLGIIFLLCIFSLTNISPSVSAESMDEMIDQLGREFDSLKPPPNSSVNADYKLEQAALGTLYTAKAINKLFEQNQEMLEKYNEMLMKYNEMVEQNKEVIRLLSIIAKKEAEKETPKAVSAD